MPGRAVVIALLGLGTILAIMAYIFAPRLRLRPHLPDAPDKVAVLPFDNRSGDPELEVLASTIVSALVASLEGRERVEVVPTRTSLMFKDVEGGVARVASELDAAYVVTGSLDRVEDRIEIDFYLYRYRDEQGLWAERLVWPYEERDSIAEDLAKRLSGSLSRSIDDEGPPADRPGSRVTPGSGSPRTRPPPE